MCVCKYLNQRVTWIGELKIFKGCFKNKQTKKHMKKLNFITQFKIEFLLPFTGFTKVLGKMPAVGFSMFLYALIFVTSFSCHSMPRSGCPALQRVKEKYIL